MNRNLPVEKIIPRRTLKPNIESTSLIVVIAMMIVWMPLYNPSSWTLNHNTMSITTFGETAVITKLRIKVYQFKKLDQIIYTGSNIYPSNKLQMNGIKSTYRPNIAIINTSPTVGITDNRRTGNIFCTRDFKSMLIPANSIIFTNARSLKFISM